MKGMTRGQFSTHEAHSTAWLQEMKFGQTIQQCGAVQRQAKEQ